MAGAAALDERTAARRWPIAASAAAVFVAHAACYGDWIVDDAGISFAYARCLADGHGLVAQVGAPPVEGFTNLAWTALLAAAANALGAFHSLWTPKLLGAAFGLFALLLLLATFRRAPAPLPGAMAVAVFVTALNPGYVLWCVAGLENGLLAAGSAVLLAHACAHGAAGPPSRRQAAVAGALAALLATVRPDAMVFAAGYPLVVLARTDLPDLPRADRWRMAAVAALVAAAGAAALTAWRWLYFGDVVPNTFWVKQGEPLQWPRTALLVTAAAAGSWLAMRGSRAGSRWLGAGVAAAAFWLLPGQRLLRAIGRALGGPLQSAGYVGLAAGVPPANRPWLVPLGVFSHLALLQFFALPKDWMGEYRFGTCFLLIGPAFLAAALAPHLRAWFASRWPLVVAVGIAAAAVVAHDTWRRLAFPRTTETPSFAHVAADQQRALRWLRLLHAPAPSLLAPDLGGRLWVGGCRLHDLAGLCDRRIARWLGRDPAALADYVFDEVRPTLIEMHGHHTFASRLSADPRLRRDYTPIWAGPDEWVRARHGLELDSGWFVRTEALGTTTIETLRRQ